MLTEAESAMVDAIYAGNLATVREMLSQTLGWAHHRFAGMTWLHCAVSATSLEIVQLLLDHGCDVNARRIHGEHVTTEVPLTSAVHRDNVELVKLLLKSGANSRIGEPVIAAIVGDHEHSLELVKLLAQHGADLHLVYPYGEDMVPMNALEMAKLWGKADVVDYLRARGAKFTDELSEDEIDSHFGPEHAAYRRKRLARHRRWYRRFWNWLIARIRREQLSPGAGFADDVVSYFAKEFGPVDPLSLVEIVPSQPQITVHCIPAGEGRNHVTLFTTGLSSESMKVPSDNPDAAQYHYAELFIQLPADWRYREIQDPKQAWPVHWLRSLGKHPAETNSWLGGAVTIYNAGQALGPDLRFDSLLLIAERSFVTNDNRTVQLYRLTPLYPEERELEESAGLPALMKAFDAKGTSFVVDVNRKCAIDG